MVRCHVTPSEYVREREQSVPILPSTKKAVATPERQVPPVCGLRAPRRHVMHSASDRIIGPNGRACRLWIAMLLCTLAFGAQAQNTCTATGVMAGLKFAANNCAAALSSSQHSIAVWFNEEPISAQEAKDFQTSGAVDAAKNGTQRTLVLITLCPGGGAPTASPAAVKSMSLMTNHAKSLLAGIQWNVKSPKD